MSARDGRPARVTLADIERAGRAIGLKGLSVQGVATALGITPAALYRHVDGRFGLETVVGESLLAELRIEDHPDDTAAEHLLSFAVQLRDRVLEHPGLPEYVHVLFPRGASGVALLENEIAALRRRGYEPDVASIVCSAIATLTISLAAVEENRRDAAATPGFERQRAASHALLPRGETMAAAHREMLTLSADAYFRLVISACVRGVLGAAPPGRTVPEIIASLETVEPGVPRDD